jgi:hypothetical protein
MRKGVLVVAMLASAAVWATSASAIANPRVFSLLDVSGPQTEPIGGFTFERPPVAGDQFAINDELYRWAGVKKGAKVGHLTGIGTFLTSFGSDFSKPAKVLFTVQAHLPGGTVIVEGFGNINPNGPSKFTIPVIGGTGIYANVRGYVNVRDLGNGNTDNSNAEFHLLP